MTTATKEAPITPKSAPKGRKPSFSSEEMADAIRNAFPAMKETPSIRYLWTNESVHRFRINWWGEECIRVSKFLHVTEQKGEIKIKERKDERQSL